MTTWVLHWPAMGVENGEFVGESDDLFEENTLVRNIILIAGLLMPIISALLLAGVSVVGAIALLSTGVTFGGLSIIGMIFVVAVAVSVVDLTLEKVALAPVRGVATVLAVALVLPAGLTYAWISRQTTRVENAELLAAVGDEKTVLRLFSSIIPGVHSRRRRLADGGKPR